MPIYDQDPSIETYAGASTSSASKWADKPWYWQQIAEAYNSALGRDPSDEEVGAHTGGGRATGTQNIAHALENIRTSPEAEAYRARPTSAASTTDNAAAQLGASWQAPPESLDPNASRMAPRLAQQGDTWALLEHGNRRPLQSDEVSSAQQYVSDFWRQFPTGFQPGVGAQSNDQYSVTAGTMRRPLLQSGLGGQGLTWSGFNTQRAQDPAANAKDAFLHYGSNASWMPQTADDAARWFNEFIKWNLESEGYKVYSVVGDRALIGTREHPEGEWIDFLANAGGANPKLAWQPQTGSSGGSAGGASGGGGSTLLGDPTVPWNDPEDQLRALREFALGLALKNAPFGTFKPVR